MGIIRIETLIHAPIERCFDLHRSVDVHVLSAKATGERAIGGVTSGLVQLGDSVTWEARHFGLKLKLTARISAFEPPTRFVDCQVSGPFKSFHHEHLFTRAGQATLVTDTFAFECPWGFFGKLADPIVMRHMRTFLEERNSVIKSLAESES